MRGMPGELAVETRRRGTASKNLLEILIKNDPFAKADAENLESQSKLLKVSILCVIFMIAEVVGGFLSNSIAIMTDAAHLLSDLLGFFVSIFALKLALRGVNKEYTYGYHRAEVLGALGSIAIIWVLTGALLIEAFIRFVSPPEFFNPTVMMVTALLGIVVNIVMGFTLHQGSHKHFHSHIGGGPCSHDHGHSMTNQAPDQYEMIDLAVINKKKPQRSRSLDIRCERNYDRNEFHHHHEREEGGECCDLKDCSVLFDGESKLTPKKKGHHDHAHEGGCCGDHGERVDTDHTGAVSHKHSQIQARDFKKEGSRSGSFNKKHDHEHNHEKCEGHDHDHHHDHHRDEEEGHGCGGHHDHEHNQDHDHAECSGHKHDHGHDHGHNHDHDHAHGGCGGHDHDHNHDHAHENHHNHEHGQGGCGGHDHDHDHDHNHEHPESNYSVDGMNVNIRAAFIHIIGDLIQSVGVFLVSIVIYFKPGWVWFDPLCTVLFSIIVFFTTVPVSQECIRVLMEASPEKVDTEHLRSQIEEIKGVLGVYELRIWNVNETKSVLSAKVLVDKHSSTVMSRVKAICKSYKIYSSTIELQVFKH